LLTQSLRVLFPKLIVIIWEYPFFSVGTFVLGILFQDMRVTQSHVQNHQEIMTALRVLRKKASSTISPNMPHVQDPKTAFLYDLSELQLARIRPGLIRVEVLPKEKDQQRAQLEIDPIPVADTTTLTWSDISNWTNRTTTTTTTSKLLPPLEELLDAKPCCHTQHHAPTINNGNPTPNGTELVVWETGILGMSVRNIPSLGWVAMLLGQLKGQPYSVPGFDATRYNSNGSSADQQGTTTTLDGLNGHPRAPHSIDHAAFLAQSAGWMASPREIMELHDPRLCDGGFLPPYSSGMFPMDGLRGHNVEFWSGGIQMWCGMCNLQRILLLDPLHFSKHLIYHTANNKQRTLDRQRFVRMTDLLGQLYTVQQQAASIPLP
jgi:hypothetical protein